MAAKDIHSNEFGGGDHERKDGGANQIGNVGNNLAAKNIGVHLHLGPCFFRFVEHRARTAIVIDQMVEEMVSTLAGSIVRLARNKIGEIDDDAEKA